MERSNDNDFDDNPSAKERTKHALESVKKRLKASMAKPGGMKAVLDYMNRAEEPMLLFDEKQHGDKFKLLRIPIRKAELYCGKFSSCTATLTDSFSLPVYLPAKIFDKVESVKKTLLDACKDEERPQKVKWPVNKRARKRPSEVVLPLFLRKLAEMENAWLKMGSKFSFDLDMVNPHSVSGHAGMLALCVGCLLFLQTEEARQALEKLMTLENPSGAIQFLSDFLNALDSPEQLGTTFRPAQAGLFGEWARKKRREGLYQTGLHVTHADLYCENSCSNEDALSLLVYEVQENVKEVLGELQKKRVELSNEKEAPAANLFGINGMDEMMGGNLDDVDEDALEFSIFAIGEKVQIDKVDSVLGAVKAAALSLRWAGDCLELYDDDKHGNSLNREELKITIKDGEMTEVTLPLILPREANQERLLVLRKLQAACSYPKKRKQDKEGDAVWDKLIELMTEFWKMETLSMQHMLMSGERVREKNQNMKDMKGLGFFVGILQFMRSEEAVGKLREATPGPGSGDADVAGQRELQISLLMDFVQNFMSLRIEAIFSDDDMSNGPCAAQMAGATPYDSARVVMANKLLNLDICDRNLMRDTGLTNVHVLVLLCLDAQRLMNPCLTELRKKWMEEAMKQGNDIRNEWEARGSTTDPPYLLRIARMGAGDGQKGDGAGQETNVMLRSVMERVTLLSGMPDFLDAESEEEEDDSNMGLEDGDDLQGLMRGLMADEALPAGMMPTDDEGGNDMDLA